MVKYSFAGHETFHCRNYWLKKGLDHLWSNKKFNDEAIISLGVGKNMVGSIRFWLKAFGFLTEDGRITDIANSIFKDDGFDPYCEDIGTVWILHYLLVTTGKATTPNLVFNEFRRHKVEFTREQLLSFLERKCIESETHFHINSIKKDIGVFINNYTTPSKSKGVEDDFSGLLHELDLVQQLEKYGHTNWYKISNKDREELPAFIVLYCILKRLGSDTSISFKELLSDPNSVGSVFALSSNGLMNKLEQMLKQYKKHLIFTDDGGVRLLQIKKELKPEKVLKDYYGI